MGTLYDLLGALPSDDAEGLRTAFRKAAKATHPDMNPDNPDAAVRFRELLRAYDILIDPEQRNTYDELLAIALQPETTPATRNYETMRKVASNTMAASIILSVLVAGYTLFGLFSKPPVAAEMPDGALEVAALQSDASDRDDAGRREKDVLITGTATMAAVPLAKETVAAPIGRFEPVPAFATYNLGVQYYPRFTAAYFDGGFVLYRTGEIHRPLTDITAARRTISKDSKRTKAAAASPPPAPTLRKPLTIVPSLPERRERESVTAAIMP
jgi:hypothetical protein